MFNTISPHGENQGDTNLWQNSLFRLNTDSYDFKDTLVKCKKQKKYFEIE
jgi:hypothetical protein